jgi:hypothetical protein
VPAGHNGVRQAAAEQRDARFVLFLAAAADQAPCVAADQQRLAHVRPQQLRQALDRRSIGCRDECDRKVEPLRAGLGSELLDRVIDRRIEPVAEADGACECHLAAPFRRRHRLPHGE